MIVGSRFPPVLITIFLTAIDKLGHAIKVDQQAQENLIGGWAVFVDAGEIAEDGDAGDVLAVECENAGGLRAEIGSAVGRRDVAMDILMLHVIRGSNLGEQAGDHFNDVRDWHGADLKLPLLGDI